MQTPPPPDTEVEDEAASSPDKSRFKLQKLLQPFTVERGVATPIIWFLLDWLVLGVSIASLLFVETWWVKVFASLVAALWIARLFVIGCPAWMAVAGVGPGGGAWLWSPPKRIG